MDEQDYRVSHAPVKVMVLLYKPSENTVYACVPLIIANIFFKLNKQEHNKIKKQKKTIPN